MDAITWLCIGYLGFVANAIIGAAVLVSIDKRGDLHRWYLEAPNDFIRAAVLELWPAILVSYYWPTKTTP